MPASFVKDRTEDGSSSTTQMRSHGTSTFVTLLRVEHASRTESLPKASTSASLSALLRAFGRVYGNERFFLAPEPLLRTFYEGIAAYVDWKCRRMKEAYPDL